MSCGLVIKSHFYGYFYSADKFLGPNLSAKSRFTVYIYSAWPEMSGHLKILSIIH